MNARWHVGSKAGNPDLEIVKSLNLVISYIAEIS